MLGFIKKILIGTLATLSSVLNVSSHTKCTTQPTIIDLRPNEYTQGLRYYPFAVNLDKCVGNCHTLNDLSNKVCTPIKLEELNLIVFTMITVINELKTLTKHVS